MNEQEAAAYENYDEELRRVWADYEIGLQDITSARNSELKKAKLTLHRDLERAREVT